MFENFFFPDASEHGFWKSTANMHNFYHSSPHGAYYAWLGVKCINYQYFTQPCNVYVLRLNTTNYSARADPCDIIVNPTDLPQKGISRPRCIPRSNKQFMRKMEKRRASTEAPKFWRKSVEPPTKFWCLPTSFRVSKRSWLTRSRWFKASVLRCFFKSDLWHWRKYNKILFSGSSPIALKVILIHSETCMTQILCWLWKFGNFQCFIFLQLK